ncbi:hypothetical protein F8M41_002110 [Gigaspora margarita]|uniref:Uncharacterized protein n=1 Tax=Gigaspora margarita TaxID=4874 RepID=A0A8H3XET4_GIGMA|nr:hypothetical protein F8M41_002110 [Gigaspora margarita]
MLVCNGKLQDLASKFAKLNNSQLDDKKEPQIIICSNIPSFAIDCCDNLGLTPPTNANTQIITNIITRHILERVLKCQKSQNDNIVLLCTRKVFKKSILSKAYGCVQFHYTASSSEDWNTLLEYRWNAFEKSERENNKTMCNILYNKDE